MAEEKKRLQYVDVIKGIGILFVVFLHLIAPCAFKNTVLNHLTEIFVVAFFFFSGYFYRPGKRSLGENIKNRAKSLMFPFFRFSLFFWLVGSIYLVATKAEPLVEAFLCLRNFLAGCIWNRVIQGWFNWEYYSLGKRYFFLADFWFLIAMLFASILFFLIADFALRSKARTIIVTIALFIVTGVLVQFGISLPYNLQLVPYWTAFMLLGAFAGQQKLADLPSLSNGTRWGLGIALLVIGIVIAMVKVPSPNMFRGSFGENEIRSMLLCIAEAIPFILGISLVCAQAEKAGMRTKELAWLGSHSLVFYVYHMFFAWIIWVITGFSTFYTDPSDGRTIALSLLLTLVCLALGVGRSIIDDKLAKHK